MWRKVSVWESQKSERNARELLCWIIGDSGEQETEVRRLTLISCLSCGAPQHGRATNCLSAAPDREPR